MRLALWVLAALVLGGLAYVRFAPADPARWHQPVEASADMDLEGGAVRVLPAAGEVLSRIDRIAHSEPRTHRIAGSVEEGRITYEARSLIFGFPDYITAEIRDGQVRIFSRLRFGRSDFGVNRARVERWLAQL